MNSLNIQKQFETDAVPIRPLESIVEQKMLNYLKKIEEELINGISTTSQKYLELKNSQYKLSKLRNYAKLNAYNSLKNLLVENGKKAFLMGKKSLVNKYEMTLEPKINMEDLLDIESSASSLITAIEKSYESLIVNQLKASLRNGDDFNNFVFKLKEYPDFKKSFQTDYSKSLEGGQYTGNGRPSIPKQPSKTDFILEAKSFLHKMWNTARQKIFSRSGDVIQVEYITQKDEKVSTICREWEGRVLPIDQSHGIIPQHVNCRCRWEEI
jgi:hypothetical protein